MSNGLKTALTVVAAYQGGFYVTDGRRYDHGVITEPLASFTTLGEALMFVAGNMGPSPETLATAANLREQSA